MKNCTVQPLSSVIMHTPEAVISYIPSDKIKNTSCTKELFLPTECGGGGVSGLILYMFIYVVKYSTVQYMYSIFLRVIIISIFKLNM